MAVPRWMRRVGWLVLLWAGGVAVLTAVAWALKAVMRAAGLAG